MRRSFAILLTGTLLLVGSLAFATGASAATFGPTTTCSNGVNNGGGQGLICAITITNTFTGNGGKARVTIRECHGSAGDPAAACTVTTRNLSRAVTTVNQCNNSTEGGGSTLRCSVRVINNYVDMAAGGGAATVNQCNGSGDGFTGNCDPFPANTTGADITQCNDAANGGTLVRLECSASGTSGNRSVSINQCNNSGNGGGSLVICSANIENNRIAGAPAPTPSSRGGGGSGSTPPPTDTLATGGVAEPGSSLFAFAGLFLVALLGSLVFVSRRTLREIRSR
jgi:hypothetical protein